MTQTAPKAPGKSALQPRFDAVRRQSLELVSGLSDADATVQSMDDASPAKWHLAHTTWFFETMLLKPALDGYVVFDETFDFLFNSYYEAIGARQPRPTRGMVTRPTLEEIVAYRSHVDRAMGRLIGVDPGGELPGLIELGLHHEQQHQELLLTDILHLFAQNPLKPAFRAPGPLDFDGSGAPKLAWRAFEGGIVETGHDGEGFGFDCEGPRHEALIRAFALASRCVTNGEWTAFIEDGGYQDPLLWLSDGWATVLREGWQAPLYWEKRDSEYWSMTLRGPQPVDPAAPVCHVSYFEADAYATWVGKRLPSEFEWEHAAHAVSTQGNFSGSGRLRPKPAATGNGLKQMFGDVWEWTQSPFAAYPGFTPAGGAVGEYNGKFMCGQYILRGGSCATPNDHIRATYRNFFYPHMRWQFSGLRLADDA